MTIRKFGKHYFRPLNKKFTSLGSAQREELKYAKNGNMTRITQWSDKAGETAYRLWYRRKQ